MAQSFRRSIVIWFHVSGPLIEQHSSSCMWQIHQDRQEAERKASMSQGQNAPEIRSYCPVASSCSQNPSSINLSKQHHIWKEVNNIFPQNLTVTDPQVALIHG